MPSRSSPEVCAPSTAARSAEASAAPAADVDEARAGTEGASDSVVLDDSGFVHPGTLDPVDIISDALTPDTEPGSLKRAAVRLLTLGLVIATLLGVSYATGLTAHISAASVQEAVASAGVWGVLLYVVIFIGGQMLHLPGLIFIGAGAIAFGAVPGAFMALLAGSIATAVNFVFVRMLGGQPAHHIKHPVVRRAIVLLDERPLRAVLGLRLVFFTSPAITTLLALSPLRFRDHLIGSVIGMAPAVIGSALAIGFAL